MEIRKIKCNKDIYKNINEDDKTSLVSEEEIGLKLPQKSYFYYYTKIDYIKEILETDTIRLSKIINQNDKLEKLYTDNVDSKYIKCFSIDNNENLAMWGLYGLIPEQRVCLKFEYNINELKDVNKKIDIKKIYLNHKEINVSPKLLVNQD